MNANIYEGTLHTLSHIHIHTRRKSISAVRSAAYEMPAAVDAAVAGGAYRFGQNNCGQVVAVVPESHTRLRTRGIV